MRAVTVAILLALASWCQGQAALRSPCPDVFKYEPTGAEQDRWYGVISISTNSIINSLGLNIVLDSKADLLGSSTGDVTTSENIEFKIDHIKIEIYPAPATYVQIFVKYNPLLKVPMVTEIRLDGRDICDVKIPQLASDRMILDSDVTTTIENKTRAKRESSWTFRSSRQLFADPDPNNWLTFIGKPQPVTERPLLPAPKPNFAVNTEPVNEDQPDPSNWLTHIAVPPSKQPVLPAYNPNYPVVDVDLVNVDQGECGKVIKNKANVLVVGGEPTLEGQWPWQIALYQNEHVDNKFTCGGTLVSTQHVVTSAQCVTVEGSQDAVNKNTISVYLGKHNLHTSNRGVQFRFVTEIIVHPQYNASSLAQNLGILKLQKPVQFTDFVRPACLWPEDMVDLSFVIGKIGTVVGWGFDATGMATEELTRVDMPVVDQETCIRSLGVLFGSLTSDTTYCAGYRDGTAPCNGDGGGGMVINMRGTWYLRGLVSVSVALQTNVCDPSHYVIFTDLAQFIPWIKKNIR